LLLICIFFKEDIQSEYLLPIHASSVFATNLFHDGFNDIIVGHSVNWPYSYPAITIMKNISYGTFEILDTSISIWGDQNNIFAVDVNNDGWADIVTKHGVPSSGLAINYIRIYHNNDGTYSNNNYSDFNLNSSETFTWIDHGDFNGDGFQDIVVSSINGGIIKVLYNDGYGGFSAPHNYYQETPNMTACGDLNGDGRDDLVCVGRYTIVYISTTSGFQTTLLDSNYMQEAVIVDFDLDGKKDILTSALSFGGGSTIVLMFKNMGNNVFQKLPVIIVPGNYGAIQCYDFNNDGYPDILFSHVGGDHILYNLGNFQLGDTTFVPFPVYGSPNLYGSYGADLDNNGFIDLMAVQSTLAPTHSHLDIMFNDGQGHFGPNPIVGVDRHPYSSTVDLKNWPNPFEYETMFTFNIIETSYIELSVYDLQGKFITCLINQKLEGGSHLIKWRGLDQDGQSCKPGVYLAYLKVNSKFSGSVKVVKI
jgi:hypothetical protein